MYPFAEPERQQLKRHFNLFVLYLQSIGRVWGNVGAGRYRNKLSNNLSPSSRRRRRLSSVFQLERHIWMEHIGKFNLHSPRPFEYI